MAAISEDPIGWTLLLLLTMVRTALHTAGLWAPTGFLCLFDLHPTFSLTFWSFTKYICPLDVSIRSSYPKPPLPFLPVWMSWHPKTQRSAEPGDQ